MKDRDCMTAVYKYDDLAKVYDDFAVPAVAVYVNNSGKDILSEKGIIVESVQVTLSVENTSGLSLQFVDAFDPESHSIKTEIKDNFSAGTIIEVALGYGSNLTKVFKGYVTEYRTIYQESIVIVVTAVDLRKLLMLNRRKQYRYTEDTYSDVFNEILSNYNDLYDSIHIDAVPEKEELIQNDSDYNFIKGELCRKANREFFVVGGNVYFKEMDDSGAEFLELEWGKNLESFEKGKSYCNEQMKVYSCQENKTVTMLSSDVKTEKNTPSLTANTLVEEWEIEKGMNETTLRNWLDKKTADKKKGNESITGSLVGLPEIVPGRYIKISGVDSSDEGNYYISEVQHSFGSDEFETRFVVGDRKDNWTGNGKNESSDMLNKCRGLMHAVVKENWKEEEPGKVLVDFITGEEGKNSTSWLPVLQPYCGNGYGFYFHPEIGTEVIVGSMTGDINSLMVLGGIWNQEDKLPVDTAGEENAVKRIRTKGNHEIVFQDKEDAGKIQIYTNKKLHIELDDKNERVSIFDEKEENGLEIDGKNGIFHIHAKKKIVMSAGGKDAVVVDGSRQITMEADRISEKAKQNHQIQTRKLDVKGDMTELKASGSMKINSSGMTQIKGSMVKIN